MDVSWSSSATARRSGAAPGAIPDGPMSRSPSSGSARPTRSGRCCAADRSEPSWSVPLSVRLRPFAARASTLRGFGCLRSWSNGTTATTKVSRPRRFDAACPTGPSGPHRCPAANRPLTSEGGSTSPSAGRLMRAATWRSSPMVTCFVCLPLAGWASMCRPDSGRILQLHHSEVRRRERSDGRFRRRNPLKINWGGAHAGIVATPADTRLLSYVRTLLSYVRTLTRPCPVALPVAPSPACCALHRRSGTHARHSWQSMCRDQWSRTTPSGYRALPVHGTSMGRHAREPCQPFPPVEIHYVPHCWRYTWAASLQGTRQGGSHPATDRRPERYGRTHSIPTACQAAGDPQHRSWPI